MYMTEQDVIRYAKYVAVGNGTLTKTMNDRLIAGDRQVAIGIMSGRIRDLQAGKINGLGPDVTAEDIETMVESVREAIAVLQP
jgi:tetrahydromethanopterin S-methyltransferase subunit F